MKDYLENVALITVFADVSRRDKAIFIYKFVKRRMLLSNSSNIFQMSYSGIILRKISDLKKRDIAIIGIIAKYIPANY